MDDNCKTCRFWLGAVQGDPNHGLCQRFPPTITQWAETFGHDWCGEHEPPFPADNPEWKAEDFARARDVRGSTMQAVLAQSNGATIQEMPDTPAMGLGLRRLAQRFFHLKLSQRMDIALEIGVPWPTEMHGNDLERGRTFLERCRVSQNLADLEAALGKQEAKGA